MIVEDMERLEEDDSKASELAWDYLNLLRSGQTPGLSQRTQKTGTSLSVGRLKQHDDKHSHMQTSQCTNIEQNKQQYRAFSLKSGLNETSHITNTVLFYCNRQSDTTVQISSTLNRTESKLGGNIETDQITPDLSCKAEDEITSST